MKGTPMNRLITLSVALTTAGAVVAMSPASAVASTCVSWTGSQPANPSGSGDLLTGVSALRPCDVWAVGFQQVGVTTETLTEHWNGLSWTPMASSNPGGSLNDNSFAAVAVKSSTDGWAVGHYSNGTANQTLIELLSGGVWEQVSSPNPAGSAHDNFLNGVAITSARYAWAVGSYSTGTTLHSLIAHWNGTRWSKLPSTGAKGSELLGVAATSDKNAWAVGSYVDSRNSPQTLIVHWNGTTWRTQSSPNPGGSANTASLNAVAASSTSNAWAVGSYFKNGVAKPLFLHWNGKAWKQVTSASLDSSSASGSLSGVTIVSASNAWAVGTARSKFTLAAHWNGTSWSEVPTPDPGPFSQFAAVAASSSTNVWAVGTYVGTGPDLTLALHCC
jgi:hypothetical protein